VNEEKDSREESVVIDGGIQKEEDVNN